MAYTWQYLGYLSSRLRYLTQLVAGLECELGPSKDVPVKVEPDSQAPALLMPTRTSLSAPRIPCLPPKNCKMSVSDLSRELEAAINTADEVMKYTKQLLEQAREKLGPDAAFSYCITEPPAFPGPPDDERPSR